MLKGKLININDLNVLVGGEMNNSRQNLSNDAYKNLKLNHRKDIKYLEKIYFL